MQHKAQQPTQAIAKPAHTQPAADAQTAPIDATTAEYLQRTIGNNALSVRYGRPAPQPAG